MAKAGSERKFAALLFLVAQVQLPPKHRHCSHTKIVGSFGYGRISSAVTQ